MSSRVRVITCLSAMVAGGLVALATPAGAQATVGANAPLAAAARAVDSLRLIVERERAVAGRVVPPERMRSGLVTFLLDSTRISGLTRGTLRRAAERASADVGRMHGTMAARTLGALEFIVDESRPDGVRRSVLTMHVRGWPGSEGWFSRESPLPADELEDYFADVAAVAAAAFTDSSLSRWAGQGAPARPASESDWRAVSIWLASLPSEAARRCIAARMDACASALQLEPVADRLAAWYVPSDYPALVEHWTGWGRTDSLTRADAARCAITGDAALCARLAPMITLGDLLPAAARRALFSLALETGGPAALERLSATRGPIRAQLAAASGGPADSLLARWQARVMASRPSHLVAVPALASVGWTLLLAAASLRRPRCA